MSGLADFPTIIHKQVDYEERPWFYVESHGYMSEKQARANPSGNRKRYIYRVGEPREVYKDGRNQWLCPVSQPEEVEGDNETCIIVGGSELTSRDLSELSQYLAEKRAKKRAERAERRASPAETANALKELWAMRYAAGKGRRHFAMLDRLTPEVVQAMTTVIKEGRGL